MRFAWLTIIALAGSWSMALAQNVPSMIQLRVGSHAIEAELAATPAARDKGLMNRPALPANHGMLFIFPEDRSYCMWMHNTFIPLSVAFIDSRGAIVNIAEMPTGTNDYYCSEKPVRYALEMSQGWYQKKGVVPGARIRNIDKVPPGR